MLERTLGVLLCEVLNSRMLAPVRGADRVNGRASAKDFRALGRALGHVLA